MITDTRTERTCRVCGRKFKSKRYTACSRQCVRKERKISYGYVTVPKKLYRSHTPRMPKFLWSDYIKHHPDLINKGLFASPPSFYSWVGQNLETLPENTSVDKIIKERKRQLRRQQ